MSSVHRMAPAGPTIYACAQAGCQACTERLLRQHARLVHWVIAWLSTATTTPAAIPNGPAANAAAANCARTSCRPAPSQGQPSQPVKTRPSPPVPTGIPPSPWAG